MSTDPVSSANILFAQGMKSRLALLALEGEFDVMSWGEVTQHHDLVNWCGFSTDTDFVVDLTKVGYIDAHTFGEVLRWARSIKGKVVFVVHGITQKICDMLGIQQHFTVVAFP